MVTLSNILNIRKYPFSIAFLTPTRDPTKLLCIIANTYMDNVMGGKHRIYGGLDQLIDPSIFWKIVGNEDDKIRVGGINIPLAQPILDREALPIWGALAPLPRALLTYLFKDRFLHIVDHKNFIAMKEQFLGHASARLGANVTENCFVIDRDLLTNSQEAGKVSLSIWYAVGSLIAGQLNDVPGFNRARFQAQFVRYIYARVLAHGSRSFKEPRVSKSTQAFMDALYKAKKIDSEWLFRTTYSLFSNERLPNLKGPILKHHLPMGYNILSYFRKDLLPQIWTQGFTVNLNDFRMSFGMVNAKEKGRPESKHDLRLLFYSPSLNKLVSSSLSVRGWSPAILLSGGLMATHQTERPEGGKMTRIFLGGGLDLGLDPKNGLIVRSYIGIPVFLKTTDVAHDSGSPYWEAGIVYLGSSDDSLFLGLSMSAPLIGAFQPYLGFVGRYEGF